MKTENIFPACKVEFPASIEGRSAAFFLAAEEYFANEMPENNYVFFWQLRPTCVFGRHQDPSLELDIDFCQKHSIELVRRKSGGGTIFADENNIMVSLVTVGGAVEPVFNAFSQEIASCLKHLGAPMKVSGRNDICLEDGRKICGGAFYHLKNRNIVHCTMLYDTNMELMRGCLTPARAKLASKGVKSVPSRIGLLREFFPFSIEELRKKLGSLLTNRTLVLTDQQVSRISEIEKSYHETTYIYGRKTKDFPKPAFSLSRRIEDCGRIDMEIYTHSDLVCDVKLRGDFFETGDAPATESFRKAFIGIPGQMSALKDATCRHHPEKSVRGLSEKALLEMLSED